MLLDQCRYDETLKVNYISVLDVWVFWHYNNFEYLIDGAAASGSLKIQVDTSGSCAQRSRFSGLCLQWYSHDSRDYGTQFIPPWAQNCFSWQVSHITSSIKFLPWLALFSLLHYPSGLLCPYVIDGPRGLVKWPPNFLDTLMQGNNCKLAPIQEALGKAKQNPKKPCEMIPFSQQINYPF